MNVDFLTARVNAPSGNHTDAQIIETEDGNHSIRFVPKVNVKPSMFILFTIDIS